MKTPEEWLGILNGIRAMRPMPEDLMKFISDVQDDALLDAPIGTNTMPPAWCSEGDRTIPELPEGWFITTLHNHVFNTDHTDWFVAIRKDGKPGENYPYVSATGKTPQQAVLNAVSEATKKYSL